MASEFARILQETNEEFGFQIGVTNYVKPEDAGDDGDITNMKEVPSTVWVVESKTPETSAVNGTLKTEFDLVISGIAGWIPKVGNTITIRGIQANVVSFTTDTFQGEISSYNFIARN